MAPIYSDALVFFGATGDLAYKMVFPALQAMVKRGHLNVPVIGVAKAGWNLDQLRERARSSLETHGGGVDRAAFDKLLSLLHYVDGDKRYILAPDGMKVGDTVVYSKYGGTEITFEGEDFLILSSRDVLAKITKK